MNHWLNRTWSRERAWSDFIHTPTLLHYSRESTLVWFCDENNLSFQSLNPLPLDVVREIAGHLSGLGQHSWSHTECFFLYLVACTSTVVSWGLCVVFLGWIYLHFSPIQNWVHPQRMAVARLYGLQRSNPQALRGYYVSLFNCHQESSKAFVSSFIHCVLSCRNMSAAQVFLRNLVWERHFFLLRHFTANYKQLGKIFPATLPALKSLGNK